MATDRCRDALTHPCLRVSAAQAQKTEMKFRRPIQISVMSYKIRPKASAEQIRMSEAKEYAKALSEPKVH